nr:hypothetical protein [Tanacetum cinerariifolium]
EPSYNLNYDDNYYAHESLSFPCCDYCEGSHETFQCQPDNQNVDFSGSDQIQTLQYPDVNPPPPEIKKPQILFQTWETFFAIRCSQPEDSNELYQKLLKDLKELAEYEQSTSTDRPIFLNDNEDHPVQNKESLENSSEENVVSKTNQQPPQDSDIHQLIEECSVEVLEEQKQKMEDTMFDLEQEVKNVKEQPAGRRNRAEKSLQNFRVVHKSPISVNFTSQISSVHAVTQIQSTKELEHLLSMGKCEVTLEDKIEYDMPSKDVCSPVFTPFSNPLFKDNDNFDSSDDESLPDEDDPAEDFKIYSNPLCDEDEINSNKLESHCFNVESDFVESLLNRDTFIDFSSKFDFSEEINVEIADMIIESIPLLHIPVQDGNSQQEEIDIVTSSNDVLPPSDDNDDDLSDELLLGEADLFLSDNSIPPVMKDIDEPDEHFNPGGEIFVSTNNEDVDYFPFMFVIRIFLPYLILLEISPLFLSAESEDTIFDPGIFN